MRMGLDRLQCFHHTDWRMQGSVRLAVALCRRVSQPELHRVYPQLLAQLVQQDLHCKATQRGPWGPISGGLGFVVHHVVGFQVQIGNAVGSQHAVESAANGRPGISAGFQGQKALSRRDLPFGVSAQFHLHVAPGSGTGCLQNVFAAHGHRHRAVALPGKDCRHRLQVGGQLAAETAADLHWDQLDLGRWDAQDEGGIIPDAERVLRTVPNSYPAIVAPGCRRALGLNIALVHRLGPKLPLHHHRGLFETLFEITQP